ncbi:NtaA/DmoA family FMN-dependent monooxygenase [Arenivirga flava]
MFTPSHIQHGQWRRPDARYEEFETLAFWQGIARTLERGRFDAMFFADVVGTYGPIGGSLDVNAAEGLQLPNNDPSVLLAALIGSTEHLGLAMTSSILQAHPFEFARRVSTLDHLSGGRVAWNIVTSYQENAARNFGLDRLPDHDERYRQAEEYLEVVYKLWEGSWDDDAVVRDKSGVFSDPAGVHRIGHRGEFYAVEGPHLSAPSPQRTPTSSRRAPPRRSPLRGTARRGAVRGRQHPRDDPLDHRRHPGAHRGAGPRRRLGELLREPHPDHRQHGGGGAAQGARARGVRERVRLPAAREHGRAAGGRRGVPAGDEAPGHRDERQPHDAGVDDQDGHRPRRDGRRPGQARRPTPPARRRHPGADRGPPRRAARRRRRRHQPRQRDAAGHLRRVGRPRRPRAAGARPGEARVRTGGLRERLTGSARIDPRHPAARWRGAFRDA